MFNRLLDPSGTAAGDVAASRPSKRTDATLSAEGAAGKEKGGKSGSTTDADPRAASFSPAAPEAPPGTPILIQTGEIPIGGLAGKGAPTLPRSVPAAWIAQSQAVVAPDLQAMGPVPGGVSRNNIPPSSARDIAFALCLTRQPAAIDTAAMRVYLTPGSPTLRTPDPSNSNDAPNLSNQPGGVNEAGSHTAEVPPENPEVVLQNTAPVALEPSRRDPQAGVPGSSLSQSESLRSQGADSAIRAGVGFRSLEVSTVISPWNVSAGSTPQNRGAGRNSLTMAPSFKMPAPTETATVPVEAETQTEGLTRAPAPILEKTTPESRLLGPSQDSSAPETHIHAKTPPTPHSPDQELDRLSESSTSPHSPVPGSGVPATMRQETSMNDAQKMNDAQNKGRAAEDPECNGNSPRVVPTEKLSQLQSSHAHMGAAGDGIPLVRAAEPGGAPQPRTKTLTPPPPQAPVASPEAEVASTAPSKPVREISLRLAVAASSDVEVQVAERAGKVQVTVRTADPDLAKSLQGNLGELVGRLQEKGFKTDAWNPVTGHGGVAVREPSPAADTQSHSDSSGSQGGQSGSRQGQRDSSQQQQGRWKAQFEETLAKQTAAT